MPAVRINHVSVQADDLEASIRFYVELFGMERIPTARFEQEIVWLRLGDQQLHLFKIAGAPPRYHHLAIDVDDFEEVYRRAKDRGLLDGETFQGAIRSHPAGWVQMYLRDPAGNLVEVDWPDIATLDAAVAAEIPSLDDEVPQIGSARAATLYHAGPPR
jgi:catechol 2,3-dioxygenase-like lactoylglutathione lyase family enzyme